MLGRRSRPTESNSARIHLSCPSALLLALAILTQLAASVQAQEAPTSFLQFPPRGEPRNASWSPRSGHTVTVVDDAMILIGGWDSVTLFNDVLRWQYAGEDWLALPPPPFSPRFGHATVYHAAAATLVLVGGLDNSVQGGAALNDVYSSADGGLSWTTLALLAPFSPRYIAGLVSAGSSLWLAGGFPGDPSGVMDLWRSTDGGTEWTDLTRRRAPVSRFALTLGVAGGAMWLIGGLTTERPFQVLNDVWQLDTTTGIWTPKDPYPVPSSFDLNQFGRGVEHQGSLVMIGGWSVPQLGSDGQLIANPADHLLQFDGAAFTRRPIAPLHPITFPALASYRGSLVVQGGENFEGVFWNEVYVSSGDYAKPRPPKPGASSTGAGEAAASTGGNAVATTSTGAANGGSTGAAGGSTSAAGAGSTSTGQSSAPGSTGNAIIGNIGGGPADGSLNSAVGGGSSGGDRFGSMPKWALILCVVLGALIVACAICIVFAVRRRRKRQEYDLEEQAQIDATLAAQAERERQADLEAQRQKKALAAAGGPGARPLAATKEEKARAEKELRKLTFGGATAAAIVGGAAVGGASKDNKSNGYDQLSDKESLSRGSAGEPRTSLVGPPSVTALYAGHERSSLSVASNQSGSSASSTPTVSRRNSFVGNNAAGSATPGSTPAAPVVAASHPPPRPTLASFLSPHDGGLTPSAPPMPLAAAAGVGAGATVAAGAGQKQTTSVSPPLHQQHAPPPPPSHWQQPAPQPTPPPRLAPLTIPHNSPPPLPIVPAPVPVRSIAVPSGPPPPPPSMPPPASAAGPSSRSVAMPVPSAPQLDAADATHALELPMVLEYNYTFNADE